MVKDWQNYHHHLLATNFEQAEEFLEAWGPLGEHVSDSNNRRHSAVLTYLSEAYEKIFASHSSAR
jgi:hypothetical protein